MNSDILGILNSTDQWYNSPQDCARSRRPMMREQASLDTFWWSFFFFFPTDFSVTRDVLPDSSAIACFSRMSQLSLQKQENSQVCPCRLHQCMPWLSEASAILCSSLYAFLVLADNDGCDSWSLQSDPTQKYSSSFHSDSRWFQISTSEKVPPLSCTTHPFPIFVLDILDILPWPAFPAESFLTLIWATTICWSVLCGRDTFFPSCLPKGWSYRCICSHDTGSLPCFHVWPSGSPNPHPTTFSRVSFRLLKLKAKFLIFLFLDLFWTASLPGCCFTRLPFFKGVWAWTTSHGRSTPTCAGPFKLLSSGGLSSLPWALALSPPLPWLSHLPIK